MIFGEGTSTRRGRSRRIALLAATLRSFRERARIDNWMRECESCSMRCGMHAASGIRASVGSEIRESE